jgi:hypothetical protein
MPSLNIGQQGHTPGGVAGGALKSTPKITRINGDDFLPVVYRNMGNNHAYPFIWAESRTMDTGDWTVLSGVSFHGMAVSEYCMVTVGGSASVAPYVTKDTAANTITVTTAASGTVDIIVMMGYPQPDLASFACRGNTGARQMLP